MKNASKYAAIIAANLNLGDKIPNTITSGAKNSIELATIMTK